MIPPNRRSSRRAANTWPFDQPRNCASISLRSIVFGGAPILHVSHDSEDHGWQFLGRGDASESDACVIALDEAVALDPSVLELADLPPGWHAWRSTPEAPWQRAPTPRSEDADGSQAVAADELQEREGRVR